MLTSVKKECNFSILSLLPEYLTFNVSPLIQTLICFAGDLGALAIYAADGKDAADATPPK